MQIDMNSNWIKTTEEIWGGVQIWGKKENQLNTLSLGGWAGKLQPPCIFSADFLQSLYEQEVDIGLIRFCNVG